MKSYIQYMCTEVTKEQWFLHSRQLLSRWSNF